MANELILLGAGASGVGVAAPVAGCTMPGGNVLDGDTFQPTNTTTGTVTSYQWQRSTDDVIWANFTTNGTAQSPTLNSTEYGYAGAGGQAFIRVTATGPGGSSTSAGVEFTIDPSG